MIYKTDSHFLPQANRWYWVPRTAHNSDVLILVKPIEVISYPNDGKFEFILNCPETVNLFTRRNKLFWTKTNQLILGYSEINEIMLAI